MEEKIKASAQIFQNEVVQPLLTDFYQLTMAYSYWKSNKIDDVAVFELFFRKNPFGGEFTIFSGLEECLKFLNRFRYTQDDIDYIKKTMPYVEEEFFNFLSNVNTDELTVYAIDEGSVVFPRLPLLRIEGPLIIAQLVESTLLNLVNYASLMVTNAARYRMAAGRTKLLEFGLRRAQGPDGGLSASKCCYLGGFDGTSNALAGKLYNIPVRGTHGHSYVTSFLSLSDVRVSKLRYSVSDKMEDLMELSLKFRKELVSVFKVVSAEVNDGELAAFVSYAIAFPYNFTGLVDTYDVLKSGLINFCSVALAINTLGYRAVGIRIDSGDLAYLSNMSRQIFAQIGEMYGLDWFKDISIMVSNNINEETILSLNEQNHQIDIFGVGTHLVTCQRQPALGCVYKLVEINGNPRIKLTQEVSKMTIPGRKDIYRLYGENNQALIDVMQLSKEEPPFVNEKFLCRHPFEESKRAYVRPQKVEQLLKIYWKNGQICKALPNMEALREKISSDLNCLRSDICRNLNPTPYKVALSDQTYNFLHELWLKNAPIGELF